MRVVPNRIRLGRSAVVPAVRSPASRFVVSQHKRVFSTDSKAVVPAAPTAVAPATSANGNQDDAVVEEPKGLLGRGYEWYPLIGLGITAAVTQEWWIFDEYAITGACCFGVMYAGYILGYDMVMDGAKAAWQHKLEQNTAALGIRLDNLNRWKMLEEFSLSHADEMRNLYAEEAKINQMAVDYQNLKHQLDTRNAILAKLRSIKVLEDETRRQAIGALSKKASEYVQQAFLKAPPAVKFKAIETGIQNIAPELTTRSIAIARPKPPALAPDDPVKLLFDEFLAQPRTYEELGVKSFVQQLMTRKGAKH